MSSVCLAPGRLAVSDIALKQELPDELSESLPAYVGCVAGAILISEYRELLGACGFWAVEVVDTGSDLNAYAKAENAACCSSEQVDSALTVVANDGCCGSATEESTGVDDVHAQLADLLRRFDVNDFAASVRVLAVKSSS